MCPVLALGIFRGGMVMKPKRPDASIIKFLQAYRDDLTWQLARGGFEFVNTNSKGTPEFKSGKEPEQYLLKLRSDIRILCNYY